MTLRKYILPVLVLAAGTSWALTLEEAKKAYNKGDYSTALTTLQTAADKDTRNAQLNLMTGVALLRTGHADKAETYLRRGGNDGNVYIAEIEFDNYRFDQASERLEEYETARRKQKKPAPAIDYSSLEKRIELGRSMLDRVEKIAIIDSITVDADNFFRAYRLSAPTGQIKDTSTLPQEFDAASPTTVYITESGETMLWAAPGKNGKTRLMQSTLLADGTWEQPSALGDVLAQNGDANYPFLMSDGMTLYYASNGDGSLGGYDIFISRNDGETFLQPQNIGMPYNSPYNDYMLAIDELTGAGWWATDRNQIPGKLTVYVFVPQDLRINYPVDTPDLADRAKLTNIAATRDKNTDYSKKLKAIASIDNDRGSNNADIILFALPDGRICKSLDDFHSQAAIQAMREYLMAKQELEHLTDMLAEMRRQYSAGRTDLADSILKSEVQIERMRTAVKRIANSVVRAEMNQ